jgi:hypothetical protein
VREPLSPTKGPPISERSKNRSLFRDVNDRIRSLNAASGVHDAPSLFLCECARADCITPVEVPVDVYAEARSSEVRFVVSPGHELEHERVLKEAATYSVVALQPTRIGLVAGEGGSGPARTTRTSPAASHPTAAPDAA